MMPAQRISYLKVTTLMIISVYLDGPPCLHMLLLPLAPGTHACKKFGYAENAAHFTILYWVQA